MKRAEIILLSTTPSVADSAGTKLLTLAELARQKDSNKLPADLCGD